MRSLVIDIISFNEKIKYKEVSDMLGINYENVRKIWHTYVKDSWRTKINSKKFAKMRRRESSESNEAEETKNGVINAREYS